MIRTINVVFVLMLFSTGGYTYEVYQWVDEAGVVHFSEAKPDGNVPGVRKLQLEDTTPPDFDPDEDRYGVEEQAKRMAELREDRQKKRDAALERQRNMPQPPLVIYQQPYQTWSRRVWLPPPYPWVPVQPVPPIAVPYRSPLMRPPGG